MRRRTVLLAVGVVSAAALVAGCQGLFARADAPTVASRLEQARTLYDQQRFGKALKIFKKLTDQSVYDAAYAEEATFYVAECYYQQRRYVEAHEAYRTLLEEFHSNRYFDVAVRREFTIGADYCTGRVSSFWKKKGFGAKILDKALDYQPFGEYSAQARLILGDYYFDDHDYDEALFHYELLIGQYSATPEATQAQYRKAICLYRTVQGNRYDSAEIGKAIKGLKDAEHAVGGQASSKTGRNRLSDIRRKLDDLREVGAKENYDLARFFLKNGNKTAAATYFYEVLEDAPNSTYAQRARKELNKIEEENVQ